MQSLQDTLAQLSIKEKCELGSGGDTWHSKPIPRLDIPSVLFHDGPHGLRKQPDPSDEIGMSQSEPATCFPTASISACSFDPELLWQLGAALGKEALLQKIDVVLGPGINIKRSPLCGRNFEYFSEDPLLSGELAAAFVQGMQSQGIGASLKHFAANNQEFWRMIGNSQVDERTLREIYLKAFEIVVRKAQPWTIMPSYNRVNGFYACQNEFLLTKIAREEWGFEGLFISDWGAVENRVEAVRAGMDLQMPSNGGYHDKLLLKAVENGEIEERFVDRAVLKLLELVEKCQSPKTSPTHDVYLENHQLARRILTESAVLLKNLHSLLPVSPKAEVLIVGELAEKPHYQGSGSSRVNPTQQVSLTQALTTRGLGWKYLPGYQLNDEGKNSQLLDEACQAAKGKDAVIVVAGLTEDDEAEGYDRQHLELQSSQNELIRQLAMVNPNLIVVLQGGGVMSLPWLDEVSAVLFVGLGGQAFGEGCLDLLLGDANPSGKLAETWPHSLADVPSSASYGQRYNTPYIESIFVGYRYYETAGKSVQFPFGHGLSYTSFDFSDLQASTDLLYPNEDLLLKLTLTNTGKRVGREVVQVYISAPESLVFRSLKELKGFMKVELQPGETKKVEVSLAYQDFAFWNPQTHAWEVEVGTFEVLVGNSSADLPLKVSVQLKASTTDQLPDFREVAPQYYRLPQNPIDFSLKQFENLPGSVKVNDPVRTSGNFDLNSNLWEARNTWQGRLVTKFALDAADRLIAKKTNNTGNSRRIIEASSAEAPLRSFNMGGVPMNVSIGMCHILNAHYLKGLWYLLRSRLKGK
jgi:beta-glucosidase